MFEYHTFMASVCLNIICIWLTPWDKQPDAEDADMSEHGDEGVEAEGIAEAKGSFPQGSYKEPSFKNGACSGLGVRV